MQLSKELQKHLELVNSRIELAKTIDNELPENYAFYKPLGRKNFRVEFGETQNDYSVVLFERTNNRNYEMCYFRGIINSLDRLSELINDWIEDNMSIELIDEKFPELEQFQSDEYECPNEEIERMWNYIKNTAFNDTEFWKHKDWEERFVKLVAVAKRKEEWKKYYPFTSHYMLRFSLDSKLQHTWELDLNLVPAHDTRKGKYIVNVPEIPNGKSYYFVKLEEATNFYDRKMKEYQPIKWIN